LQASRCGHLIPRKSAICSTGQKVP